MRALIFFLFFGLTQPLFAFGIYQWLDEDGRKTYGNNPPENTLKDEISLPEITIVAGENTYQETSDSSSKTSTSEASQSPVAESATAEQAKENANIPSMITILSPKEDEAIRANDGTVSIRFSVQPPLRDGESIVVYLDGKQQSTSPAPTVKLEALNRGTHSLFAIKRGADGNVMANSENIKFHVLRHSKLF